VRILLPWGDSRPLTYLWPVERLGPALPGLRVEVPLGRSRRVGVLLATGGGDDDPAPELLKPVLRVLDPFPLWGKDVLELVLWASDYYRAPPGDFVRIVLPPGLRHLGRRPSRSPEEGEKPPVAETASGPVRGSFSPSVKPEARAEPHALTTERFLAALVSPGPGLPVFTDARREERTALYREAARKVLGRGNSVLVLAPTSSRCEEIHREFLAQGLPVFVYRGDLPEREKAALWREAARSSGTVLIGLRTAVFLPRPGLGLLVVDEEHESAYREEGRIPYHARDLAVVRARLAGARILLASATPSLETVRNLRLRRYARLMRSPTSPDPRPVFGRLDPRRSGTAGGMAAAAFEAVARHLEAGGRVAVYLNRKGYARALLCPACGWRARCPRCGTEMAVHLVREALSCPRCGRREPLPTLCPSCAGPLRARGGGIERLVHVLRLRFPRESVHACGAEDGDEGRSSRILVGTRRLREAIERDPASLLLVADADAALVNPEFRARERFVQDLHALSALLAPAGALGPEVLLQSRGADEEVLSVLLSGSYPRFAWYEDGFRRRTGLPPYAAWALVEAEGRDEEDVRSLLEDLRTEAERLGAGAVFAFGPLPYFGRRGAPVRARLLLQAVGRGPLHRVLVALERGGGSVARGRGRRPWRVRVDPETLL
jgi:primosomal protein N' (replication factor Y)